MWIIGAGRLKRCSPKQLRHCSEREKILAEKSEAVSTPWSFNSLMHLVNRGQYQRFDDLEEEEDRPDLREPKTSSKASRSSSAPPSKRLYSIGNRPREDGQDGKPTKAATPARNPRKREEPSVERRPREDGQDGEPKKAATPHVLPPQKVRKDVFLPSPATPSGVAPLRGATSSSLGMSALEQHPPFQAARERAQARETRGHLSLAELLEDATIFQAVEESPTEQVLQVEVPLPENRSELKKFMRDSTTWVSNKLKKGVEIKWKDIPQNRIEDFKQAKAKELKNWIRQAAVRLVSHEVPRDRLLRMRWIYTLKQDGSSKARIVILGYADPDLTGLQRASPTMTRRSRSLFLTMAAQQSWTILKGDVRGAFLQGLESETERQIYATPVEELARELGGDGSQNVQILKACYGLANAPSQWHSSVTAKMLEAGFEALQTDACMWRLMDRTNPDNPLLIGLACAHVDDFLFAGEATHADYQQATRFIFEAYQWTPWEVDSFQHCGISMVQNADGSTSLDHSEFCASLEQIRLDAKKTEQDKPSESEHKQL